MKTQINKQADELAASEVLTETNSGTYSAAEACRSCGSGDPRFADYRIYTRVGDGHERREGCSADDAPGYARRFRRELSEAQTRLRELRRK